MSTPAEEMQELSRLIDETRERLIEDCYFKYGESLDALGLSDSDGPVPLELWNAVAQALADASGYRIVLQAEILELIDGEQGCYQSVGHAEVASSDPTFFVQPAGS